MNLFVSRLSALLSAASIVMPALAAEPGVAAPVRKSVRLSSGLFPAYKDAQVKPQDDFFRHVNGHWLDHTDIPSDKSGAGAFLDLREATLPQLRVIIDSRANAVGVSAQSEGQKIADMYASFMDTAAIEAKGLKPLEDDFVKIAALTDKSQIPALVAYLNLMRVNVPYHLSIHQDAQESTRYVADLGQSGLGLPDRDYYLLDGDARLKTARTKYMAHIEKMLAMSGDKQAAQGAADVLAIETELAKVQWTKVENRDPVKTYNRTELTQLDALTPGYDMTAFLTALGIKDKVTYLVVSQPSYLTGFSKVMQNTPLDAWKTYFKWHLLSASANTLSKSFADESFAFNSTVLNGIPKQEDRWKRGVRLVNGNMGESLGKLYVEKHFPAASKVRMEALVANLLEAYRESIDTLDWMSPATKKEAQAKLATFKPKIGYPNKWRDYSALQVVKGDALGNAQRASRFSTQFELNKLGKPIDREEWGMTPQTVNAYYNPEMNEIVFPAAILQAPFFDPKADDAVNYGGIGAVIGHEISHGFDDQGAQYDGKGNLRDWWTKEDHEKFAAKTSVLIKQYSAFSPLPGYNVNGELTLGENIADNSGLAIAYKAYKLSLNGKPAPIFNGLTGDQRFFTGFAQVWRGKTRDEATIVRIKTDPHSPGEFRANGTLRNMPDFYKSFDVKEGDKMYLSPKDRVSIW